MKYLNEILIEWDNGDDIKDSGLIKASDVKYRMNYHLTYKLDKLGKIKIFNNFSYTYTKYKDKVYINNEHVQLKDGYTVNEYEPGEYRVYIEDFDKIKEIEDFIFYDSMLMSIIIPDSVTKIGDQAFEACTSLTSVTIPDSVMMIPYFCFFNCTSLTSITIPDSVTKIDQGAFVDCSSLISITIPNSVTEIGINAFANCTSLTSIIIPNSVTSIAKGAFFNCNNLKKVYVEDIKKFNLCIKEDWSANPTVYGAKLIELKKDLNEALISWNNSDIENSGIINSEDVKKHLDIPYLPLPSRDDTLNVEDFYEDKPGVYKCICKINWAKFLTQWRLYIFNTFIFCFKNTPDDGAKNRWKLNEYIKSIKSYKDDIITFLRIPEENADDGWWGSEPQFKLPREKTAGAIPVFETNFGQNISLIQILWEIFVEEIEPNYGENDRLLIANSRKK